MKFKVGMRVEACSREPGYEGGWFEGVILSCKRNYCEVRFDKFKSEDGDQLLVENTKSQQLRPLPPRTNVRNWAIGDLVEAKENEAWWRGVVTQVLPAQQYHVKFPESKSENIFHQSNIRVRQDWENGQWYQLVPSPLQETRPNKGIELENEMVHQIEVNAYRSVLQALDARKTLDWKIETLLTKFRVELHITDEENLLLLEKLNLTSEDKMHISSIVCSQPF